ncbi:alcohol dehydrogenase transcription factor myb/SANT-like domain-containing protein [Phthorimaea operculella]|nr:alcohol dehydrogenase transcription factor myb/SANT-like domain-containing protein [Phthorimaea operculella]
MDDFIDKGRLIDEVRFRACLWDAADENYKNRDAKNKAWEEIGYLWSPVTHYFLLIWLKPDIIKRKMPDDPRELGEIVPTSKTDHCCRSANSTGILPR